ncbi:MAG: 50S ribosomal protein L11 methyltransferase [Miltoncostaeaceae bacterium]
MRVACEAAEWVGPELAEVLGAGFREREERGTGESVLEFWVPAAGADAAARRVDEALGALGVSASVEQMAEDERWRTAMHDAHRPVAVGGRLLVRPPWEPPDPALLDVVIDPGMAFGTAQHGTTRQCLRMLCALPAGGSLLDAGCGTGVLAIAARRLGFDPVSAFDIDPLAVDATLANARANGVGLTVGRRTIGRDRLPRADVVLANLTATVLAELAPALPSPGPAHMVLSGLRPEEVDRAVALFAPHGLIEAERAHEDGWSTVRLARR